MKEQVIAGTPSADSAELIGAEVIQREDALIEVKVVSKVRQVGKTTIARIIADALAREGYTNVELVRELPDAGDNPVARTQHGCLDIKIRVIDNPKA